MLAAAVVTYYLWPPSPDPKMADRMLTDYFPNLPGDQQ
jgi:hypothetical protein